MLVQYLTFGWSTKPFGSKRVNVNFSTNSSSGTPYCKPIETAIAKQLMTLRNDAPSLCRSTNISPSVPSAYSPVRRNTVWPAIFAFCVHPRRLAGSRLRSSACATLRLKSVLVAFASMRFAAARISSGPSSSARALRAAASCSSSSGLSANCRSSAALSDVLSVPLFESGCDSLEPSRYNAIDLSPSSHERMYVSSISATVASFGRLTVLLCEPEITGCAAAITRTCPM